MEGVLPLCTADEQLTQFPVDPSLAGMSDSFSDNNWKNHGDSFSDNNSKNHDFVKPGAASNEQVGCLVCHFIGNQKLQYILTYYSDL